MSFTRFPSNESQLRQHSINPQDATAPMEDSPESDPYEKRLRFGCGFVFGASIAFFEFAREAAAFTGLLFRDGIHDARTVFRLPGAVNFRFDRDASE